VLVHSRLYLPVGRRDLDFRAIRNKFWPGGHFAAGVLVGPRAGLARANIEAVAIPRTRGYGSSGALLIPGGLSRELEAESKGGSKRPVPRSMSLSGKAILSSGRRRADCRRIPPIPGPVRAGPLLPPLARLGCRVQLFPSAPCNGDLSYGIENMTLLWFLCSTATGKLLAACLKRDGTDVGFRPIGRISTVVVDVDHRNMLITPYDRRAAQCLLASHPEVRARPQKLLPKSFSERWRCAEQVLQSGSDYARASRKKHTLPEDLESLASVEGCRTTV